ncbi:MAG: chemotaxis protein CheB [Desulfuromonadales bacterium]
MPECEVTNLDAVQTKSTYIVGIGASAGGLNALEQFFDNMPADSGMAFVVIQHLSPDFKSLMDDLLSRHTSMNIHRVTNGIDLQPNSIYLIPPKTRMTIENEKLYLTEKLSQHVELPIDIFFNSLASDAEDRAIGIILSGTGSDGSRGILSIHNAGGLVLVQSLESAQFDGMPRSAIASGVCDFILAPDRMPRLLVEYAVNPLVVRSKMHLTLDVLEDEGEFAEVFALLRRSYHLDFSKYKGATVGRRVKRRMEFRQIPGISDYAAILSGDPGELEALYKDLLIGVTEFFRDRQAFQFLESEIIPRLFSNLHDGEDLRVWSAACATGEEAYSLAILLTERAEDIGFMGKITVFATDVHKTSLEVASLGLYDLERLANVSPERLERFFRKEAGDQFRVTSELRKLVVFAPHNLLKDPPFTRLDLICCRNLLIYFQSSVQEKVISVFHFALKTNSVLFLGSSEGLGGFADEFEVIASQHKMFSKIRDLKLAIDLDAVRADKERVIPVAVFQPAQNRMISMDRQMLYDYDLLLRKHMPPGVLINENRHIIHYFGNVAEYLKMPEGRVENDVLLLVEDNLHIALSTALLRVNKARQCLVTRNVRVKRALDEFLIDLTVDPLVDEKSRTIHYHIYFERVRQAEPHLPPVEQQAESDESSFDSSGHYRQHIGDLEMELQSTRENLQTTVEELQTSNEELQATNEELLASNEELQSTNEELHSVNEELYSVNSEFERKNIDLKQLNTDHDNLLSSIDIGTIFLDRQMRIRKFNPSIAAFFKLLPQDIGRPIDHIAYHLSRQDELLADIGMVLSSSVPTEKEENTRDGKWLLIRIMPFRTETGMCHNLYGHIAGQDCGTGRHQAERGAGAKGTGTHQRSSAGVCGPHRSRTRTEES